MELELGAWRSRSLLAPRLQLQALRFSPAGIELLASETTNKARKSTDFGHCRRQARGFGFGRSFPE